MQVHLSQTDHIPGQEFSNGWQDGRYIQLQQTQQGTDENEKREDGEQQIKGQSGALDGDVVAQIAQHH